MKKFATMAISVALIGTMIAGGSLAYLSDTDSDVNVMTLGNVSIEQQEWQRAEGVSHINEGAKDGELVSFEDNKTIYPAVPKNGLATDYSAEQTDLFKWGDYVTAEGAGNGLWNDDKLSNVMDKIVMVKNTGKSDAYYRTLIAFECPEDMEYSQGPDKEFMMNINGYSLFHWDEIGYITVDEARYLVLSATYQDILEPGEVSRPSLLQVVMTHNATNEDMELLGEDYKILVLSQAVQAAGFENAEAALVAGFGEATAPQVAEWFEGIEAPIFIEDASALTEAMTTLLDGTNITNNITKVVYGKIADYSEIVNGGYDSVENEGIISYYVPNGNNYDVYMLSDGVIYAPADSSKLFYEMKNVTEIDTSNLDFSQVENAFCMFTNCANLETLDTADWDMSNVTNMQSMFYGCNNLVDIDVSKWDTSNVTNMRMVFFRCYELPGDVLKGVENWDVSNVTNFHSMFKHAYGLTSLDLSKWDTSNATNMTHMFANIGANLTTLDLSSFDTSKVTDMSWMFYSADKLEKIYVGDGWTTAALDPANPTCFYNNQALVGGEGTAWLEVCDMANPNRPWESSAKLDYAIVDGGVSNPGLLTYKTN